MNTSPLFVYVSDLHFGDEEEREFRRLFALFRGKNFDYGTPAEAHQIFDEVGGVCRADAQNLLVFIGSFGGDVVAAINYARQIKNRNPHAQVYYWSVTDERIDPIFDGCLYRGNRDRLHQITLEFVMKARQLAS